MKIGIIVAMDKELVQLRALLDHVTVAGVATYMERADRANVNLFI